MSQRSNKKTAQRPFRPYISVEQIEAFLDIHENPSDDARQQSEAATTGFPLLDEVLRAMPIAKPVKAYVIADYLGIAANKMTGAIELVTGMKFTQICDIWKLRQVARLEAENPKASPDEIAKMLGLGDRSTLWNMRHRDARKRVYKKHKEVMERWKEIDRKKLHEHNW